MTEGLLALPVRPVSLEMKWRWRQHDGSLLEIPVEPDRESDDGFTQPSLPALACPEPGHPSPVPQHGSQRANILVAVTALATGPLQARALGVEGRGLLAAIIVPLTFAAQLIPLGLHEFAEPVSSDEGVLVGVVFGSVSPPIVLTA